MGTINNSDDYLDVREIIERVEELREEISDAEESFNETASEAAEDQPEAGVSMATCNACGFSWNDALSTGTTPTPAGRCPLEHLHEEREELKTLESLLDDLKGYGGDHQWEGNWYPVTLIRDSYFTEAMKELVQDIGDLPRNIPSYLEIDWDATAENLRADYSEVDFDGETYWYR